VEDALQDLGIPVFHDDQHGTAIVLLAALINAAKVTDRKLKSMKVVINGAGAAGIAIARLLRCVGQDSNVCDPVEEIVACDSRGAIHRNRQDLNPQKESLLGFSNLSKKDGSLQDVIAGADVFIGVSQGNLLGEADVKRMHQILSSLPWPIPSPKSCQIWH